MTSVNLSYSVADSTSGSTNIPTVTYNTTYGYQSGVVISTTTGNTSPKLDDNTTFTKSFEEYQSNGYASLNASTGVVTWNSSNPSSTVRTMTVKCTGTLTSNGVTSSKFVIKGASQNPYTTDSIYVSYVNQGVPYGCTYKVVAKGLTMTTIDNSTSNGIFHQETYKIPQLYIEVYGSNINSGTSKTLNVSWTGGGGTVTMEGTNKPAATVSNLSISIPSNTPLGSKSYYIVAKLTPSGSMTGSLTISIK